MKNFLTDNDGTFSWRKALTGLGALVFFVAAVGYLILGWKELPASYTMVISGIFAFYFTKKLFGKDSGSN